jgi:hypothetical protein
MCSKCSTTKGMELTRVSLVDEDLNVVYDALVKPQAPVVDYLTRYRFFHLLLSVVRFFSSRRVPKLFY